MPGRTPTTHLSELADRLRAWWEASTFIGDVALVFTTVTVVNSVMMLTGSDEPKTGTFAYVHLLGRLGIVTSVVGLFYVDEARARLAHWRRAANLRGPGPRRSRHEAIAAVLGSVPRAPADITARLFTIGVAASCVVTLALAGVRTPTGGPGLYRNLVIFAVVLLLATIAGPRRGRRPPHMDPSQGRGRPLGYHPPP